MINKPVSLIEKMEFVGRKKTELVEQNTGRYVMRAFLATVFLTLVTNALFRLGNYLSVFDASLTLAKIAFASLFGWGLVMIRYTNTELFTANTMYAFLNVGVRQMKLYSALRLLFLSYLGNLIGALLTAFFLAYSGIWRQGLGAFPLAMVATKFDKAPLEIVMQAIIANFIVCTAVLVAINMKNDVARIISMVMIVFVFAILGTEHVIANFSLFATLFFAEPGFFTDGMMVFNHIILATIGNIIGGGVLIGLMYAFLNTGSFVYKD